MLINITQAIIDEAKARQSEWAPMYDSVRECMVALALKATTGEDWRVGLSVAQHPSGQWVDLPAGVAEKINDFIRFIPVEPFAFDLAAPQTVTA